MLLLSLSLSASMPNGVWWGGGHDSLPTRNTDPETLNWRPETQTLEQMIGNTTHITAESRTAIYTFAVAGSPQNSKVATQTLHPEPRALNANRQEAG